MLSKGLNMQFSRNLLIFFFWINNHVRLLHYRSLEKLWNMGPFSTQRRYQQMLNKMHFISAGYNDTRSIQKHSHEK